MSNISMYQCIGQGYERGWFTNCDAFLRIYEGARNTKKSVNMIGYEPIFKILVNDIVNILIVRQNDVDNSSSTYNNIVSLIYKNNLQDYFSCTTHPSKITYKPTKQIILFKGLNNPSGLTSIKPPHGFFTDVYFEEAGEIKDYADFRHVLGSLRGKEIREAGGHLQCTLCLNGWDGKSWIYEKFFKGRLEDDYSLLDNPETLYLDYYDKDFTIGFGFGLYLHKSTYKINEFRDIELYDKTAMELKKIAPEIYKVEYLSMWGNTTVATYPEYSDKLIKARGDINNMRFNSYTIGIDTGLSNGDGKIKKGMNVKIKSATAMELIGLSQDCGQLIAIDEFYYSNEREAVKKTEQELMNAIIDKIYDWIRFYSNHADLMRGTILVYVDCADIGFRQGLELVAKSKGLFNIVFQGSTKMHIQTRVDFSRLLMAWNDCLFSESCPNLVREIKNARRGSKGEVREDVDDHAINAWEYAWAVICPRLRRWKEFKIH